MNLAPVLRQRFFDSNGLPLAGGLLYTYAAGTSTPQASYSNAGGTTNTNPVVLDANGYADVWLDPALPYRFVLKDSLGATVFTIDNVGTTVQVPDWNAISVYKQGDIVCDSSGQGILYVSLINSNQNRALSDVAAWRVFEGGQRTVTANTSLGVTDTLVRSNSTSGNLTHTLPACSTTPIGKRITVKDVGTGTYTTSVKGAGSDLIDIANTYRASLNRFESVTLCNNGSSWDVWNANAMGSIVEAYTSAPIGGVTSDVARNVVSISLPAGTWEIIGSVGFVPISGSGTCRFSGGASTANNAITLSQFAISDSGSMDNGLPVAIPIPTVRVTHSTTTTYYLVAIWSGSGSIAMTGGISGRQIR